MLILTVCVYFVLLVFAYLVININFLCKYCPYYLESEFRPILMKVDCILCFSLFCYKKYKCMKNIQNLTLTYVGWFNYVENKF